MPVIAAVIIGGALLAVALRKWLDRPANIARDGSPSWSPDARRIAFYSEHDGYGEIYVMNADGSEPTRLTKTRSDEGYPSWSPDGRTITFDSNPSGDFDIYAMDTDGSSVVRLTAQPSREVGASWSPDGKRIAFMSNREGGFDVYMMNADGSDQARMTTTGTSWFPVFSPDNARLAFHVGRDVHVLDVMTAELKQLTTDPLNGMYPSWSPDGTRIAFMSWRNGRTEIFVMNADGSDQRLLVSMPTGDAIDPRWSPDGSRIAFVHVAGGIANPGSERTIWTVDVADGEVRQVSAR